MLAITGTKATSSVDLSEFQMIHQEELFRAAGLPFSNVVMSEAAIPAMLRNAIAVALREKTAVHLALPVDVQSRLLTPPRTDVSHAEISHIEYQASEARVQLAAQALADPQLRIVIALGHRAATELTSSEARSRTNPFLRLAETLNAPIITQLDAKGCVDETHPLSYGVLGIFGNPGLDAARALVTSADMILLFGVDRQAVDLISDSAFNQVRRVVEFEPDAGSAAYHRWYECDVVVLGKLTSNARRLEVRAAPRARARLPRARARPQALGAAGAWRAALRADATAHPSCARAAHSHGGLHALRPSRTRGAGGCGQPARLARGLGGLPGARGHAPYQRVHETLDLAAARRMA